MNDWTERSNALVHRGLAISRRFEPETLSHFGDREADEEVFALPPDRVAEETAAYGALVTEYRRALAAERHPEVRFDLEMLIAYWEQYVEHRRLEDERLFPYFNLPGAICEGVRALLNDQVGRRRRRAARARLERYAGCKPDRRPIAEQFQTLLRSRLDRPDLLYPSREVVTRDLATSDAYLEAIGRSLAAYEVPGCETAYRRLREQVARSDAFVREVILPRARPDHRLPRDLYASYLRRNGVGTSIGELVSRARVELQKTRREMAALARQLAGKGSSFVDYRDLLRELGKDRIPGKEIVPHYEKRICQLCEVIAEHEVLTLPELDLRARLADAAESAARPFPHVLWPGIIGAWSGPIELVLPTLIPAGKRTIPAPYDPASKPLSWYLAAHEIGHAIQLVAARARDQPLARLLFAAISAREGWAVYLETELMHHLPPSAQIFSLRAHLLRAARTIIEAEIREGTRTTASAARLLGHEVGHSSRAAGQEIERLLLMPGQAPSYLDGYLRQIELRSETELALGRRFARRDYHDLVLSQGFIPLSRLRERVLAELIPDAMHALAA